MAQGAEIVASEEGQWLSSFLMTVSPFIVGGNGDQLFCGTTKRTKRERPPMQRERFKWSSEKSLSGKRIKRSENLKLSGTEGIDSGRRCGSVVLSPKDAELNWLCVPRQVVPPCSMSFFLRDSRVTLDLHVARPCVEEGCPKDYNRPPVGTVFRTGPSMQQILNEE